MRLKNSAKCLIESAMLLLIAAATSASATSTQSSSPGPEETSAVARAASCVAALKSRAEPLVQRVRQGDAAAEAELLPHVTASFAFIGAAYKQGLRSPEAEQMLEEAETEQKALAPDALQRLQSACQAEGSEILAEASFIERKLVARAALKRVKRESNRKEN